MESIFREPRRISRATVLSTEQQSGWIVSVAPINDDSQAWTYPVSMPLGMVVGDRYIQARHLISETRMTSIIGLVALLVAIFFLVQQGG